ncbi:MAG: hypothetical protein A2V88_15020 [Elusimicrobia bacterium RBG_16_66_12]|nr:MAG: hypothetical protein A2V88_15020 [Elusimicrobia bacterium RBG_16_66_12]
MALSPKALSGSHVSLACPALFRLGLKTYILIDSVIWLLPLILFLGTDASSRLNASLRFSLASFRVAPLPDTREPAVRINPKYFPSRLQ